MSANDIETSLKNKCVWTELMKVRGWKCTHPRNSIANALLRCIFLIEAASIIISL
jgi:hypothetical protein